MTIKISDIVCPRCGKKNTWTKDNEAKPFCSARCKLIDLGAWADGQYQVPGDPVSSDQTDDIDKHD